MTQPGDINNDGWTNIVDVNALLQAVQNNESPDGGDLNNDGEVNVVDVNALKQHVMGGEPLPEDRTKTTSSLPVTLSDPAKVHNLAIDGIIPTSRASKGVELLRNGADSVRVTDSGVSAVGQTTSDDTETIPDPNETTSSPDTSTSTDSSSDTSSSDTTDDTSTSDESGNSLPVDPKTAIAAGIGLLALLGGS